MRFPAAIAAALLVTVPVHAVTLRVPSEYGTINEGLSAAAFGDTVLVAPGTYTDFEVRNVPGAGTRSSCA